MLRQTDKRKKNLFYLFIFIFLSTFNNISLTQSQFLKLKLKNIEVNGLSDKKNLKIKKEFKGLIFQNILFIDKKYFIDILDDNELIQTYSVKKIYPNKIEINIEKAKFLAITNYQGKNFFIGSNGKLISYDNSYKNLPYVFGKIDIKNFINFNITISKSQFKFEEINELYYFPSGRWDFKNNQGVLFKLPKYDLYDSLNLAYKISRNQSFKNARIVDLRIKNNIIFTNE